MIKCRPAAPTMLLSEAMVGIFEIEDVENLIAYCGKRYEEIVKIEDLTIKYYGLDNRNS